MNAGSGFMREDLKPVAFFSSNSVMDLLIWVMEK